MKILVFAAALAFAVLQGCAGDASRQKDNAAAETAVAHDIHDVHEHADGEPCTGDMHDAHEHEAHAAAGHTHDEHGHVHVHTEAEEEADPDEIVFPAAQAARTEFEVQEVVRGPFRETLRCSGSIYASQCQVSVVSAPIGGVATFVDGHVMANSSVSEGQGLFWISSNNLASGDAVQKARIAYHQAEADFQRIKELYGDKLVTQRDYLAAEAEYLRTKAEYEPLKVSGEKGTLVQSPVSGYVLQMSVAPGDYVDMGQPLATIANTGRMQLKAMVSQRYFDRIDTFDDARFRLPMSDGYLTVSDMNGSVYTPGRMVDEGSSLIPVVFEFDADGRFPDGAYADVVLLGRQRSDVVTVPLSALTEQQGLFYVYEQLDADCYRRIQVWRGADDGERVEILRGLNGGERIVTKGAVNVKMASASGAIPHGHSH